MNFMNWEKPGKVFISGASSGIGREYAIQLSNQGFTPVIHGRRTEKLQELKEEISNKTSIESEIIVGDLTDRAEILRIVDKIKEYEDLDVLINNAGFAIVMPFVLSELNDHLRILDVHVTSTVSFTHAALPNMLKRKRGVVINVSSTAAYDKSGMQDIMYPATKQFLNIFSENLQMTHGGLGIRTQALCPGLTHTDFHAREEMKGFPLDQLPESVWMPVDEVVSSSLEAFGKDSVVFIPGEQNRQWVKEKIDDEIGRTKKYL
ncbi:MAG: SDR family NAD(P)-dependent oxidoreductase [Proteobacteria bacterium]|nr:SDR family NAD(P)-dependent oxidoreductase [Pseudomonadota bacterium]